MFKPRRLSSNDSRKHPSAKSPGFCALPQTEWAQLRSGASDTPLYHEGAESKASS